MVDAVAQGVLQAWGLDRAVGADATGDLHADAVAGKERRGRLAAAAAPGHPVFSHRLSSVPSFSSNGPTLMEVPFLYDGSGRLG